ncbi:Alpha/Beta hydrolase protein [Gautieria morchelliformis]|nr:Alpha/Beta hydrolase protein [Gautieria morchelliformis]
MPISPFVLLESGLQVADVSVPVQGASIVVRTYVPTQEISDAQFPVLVWFHGGGFMLGDLEMDDEVMRLICTENSISCVSVDYRLAPEHPFPIPLQDCYDALKRFINIVAGRPERTVSADLIKGLIIGGSSAGANLAAVVALKARDDPLLSGMLTGQFLQVPILCPPSVYPEQCKAELLSIDQNKDAPLVGAATIARIYARYGPPDLASPDVAPLLATTHRGLPPAYFQICGLDPLRDEGFLYEKVLGESGVPTKMCRYPGFPHAFWFVDPLMPSSKKLRSDAVNGVKWLLEATAQAP